MTYMNKSTKHKQTYRHKEHSCGCQGLGVSGKDELEVWDGHVHAAVFKIDNQQGPTV